MFKITTYFVIATWHSTIIASFFPLLYVYMYISVYMYTCIWYNTIRAISIFITFECTDWLDRHRGRHRSAQFFLCLCPFSRACAFAHVFVFTYIWNIQMYIYTSSSDVFALIFDTIFFQKAVVCVGLCCRSILLMFFFVCVCLCFKPHVNIMQVNCRIFRLLFIMTFRLTS